MCLIKRRPVVIFLFILVVLCSLFIFISFLLRTKIVFLAIPYMFAPFVSTIITCFLSKIPLSDLGISIKVNRWFAVAWLLPVIFVFASLGLSLLFPSVEFSSAREGLINYGFSQETIIKANHRLTRLGISPILYSLGLSLIVGPTINALVSFGEEIGWRGLLLKELSSLGFLKSSLLIGLIWGIWHTPLILQGHNYPQHPQLGVFMMIIFTILLSPLMNYIRIKSDSVIAPSIMHGMLNALAGIPIAYVKGGNDLIVGITGISGFIVLGIANIFLYVRIKNVPRNRISE